MTIWIRSTEDIADEEYIITNASQLAAYALQGKITSESTNSVVATSATFESTFIFEDDAGVRAHLEK